MKSQIKRMPASAGVYLMRHIESGLVYVGSSLNVRRRAYSHLNNLEHGKHANAHLQAAFTLYGERAFELSIALLVAGCVEDLRAAEIALMIELSACDRRFGYNVSPVADGSCPSEESRLKMRAAKIGKKQSAETIARRVVSLAGNKHPPRSLGTLLKMRDAQLGKKHSEEHKRKIAASSAGRRHSDVTKALMSQIQSKRSPETRAKLSAALTGKKASDSTRIKLSEAALGKKKPLRSVEHCAAISEAKRAWWAKRKSSASA